MHVSNKRHISCTQMQGYQAEPSRFLCHQHLLLVPYYYATTLQVSTKYLVQMWVRPTDKISSWLESDAWNHRNDKTTKDCRHAVIATSVLGPPSETCH